MVRGCSCSGGCPSKASESVHAMCGSVHVHELVHIAIMGGRAGQCLWGGSGASSVIAGRRSRRRVPDTGAGEAQAVKAQTVVRAQTPAGGTCTHPCACGCPAAGVCTHPCPCGSPSSRRVHPPLPMWEPQQQARAPTLAHAGDHLQHQLHALHEHLDRAVQPKQVRAHCAWRTGGRRQGVGRSS